jgi:proline iminopeptidase
MAEILELYPAIDPYASGFLEVSGLHSLYWEQCGNPNGVAVIILHGGPGEGCTPTHRRFFDPDVFRIILFDQRGCGRSSPHGELKDNNPDALVQDIEKIRQHLAIDTWHVFGGSWGSTLALLYAIHYPKIIESMILRGIFLLQPSEIDWFLNGIKSFAPKAWRRFAGYIPKNKRSNLLKAYYKRLTQGNIESQQEAAIEWFSYESHCATLIPPQLPELNKELTAQALALARIEAHYFIKYTLTGAHSILRRLDAIKEIPLTVVQGRYDIICPPVSAESLIDILPNAAYYLVDHAGHSMMDPAIRTRLLMVTYELAERYKEKANLVVTNDKETKKENSSLESAE